MNKLLVVILILTSSFYSCKRIIPDIQEEVVHSNKSLDDSIQTKLNINPHASKPISVNAILSKHQQAVDYDRFISTDKLTVHGSYYQYGVQSSIELVKKGDQKLYFRIDYLGDQELGIVKKDSSLKLGKDHMHRYFCYKMNPVDTWLLELYASLSIPLLKKHPAEVLPDSTFYDIVNDQVCYKLIYHNADSTTDIFLIDTHTFYIQEYQAKLTPEFEATATYSDYFELNGLTVPGKIRIIIDELEIFRLDVMELDTKSPVNDSFFNIKFHIEKFCKKNNYADH